MRDVVREYLSYCRVEKGLSPNSIASYQNDLGKLTEWLESNDLDLLTLGRTDLREWLIDLGAQKLTESTKRRIVSSVKGLYKFLMLDGHIRNNPAEDLIAPQKGFYLPRFLTQHEVEMLLAAPDIESENGLRDRALLELMYASGLRVSEAVNLRLQDVDLDTGVLTAIGKGSKTRRVPVGTSAVEWIRRYLAVRPRNELVNVDNLFVTSGGMPLTRQAIYLMVREHAMRCGLEDVSPHTLRHSFATHMVQNDADIRSVQQMLGHADISTTQIYTHITNKQLKRNYDRFHPRSK
jgi:integrase/recombinase XerD